MIEGAARASASNGALESASAAGEHRAISVAYLGYVMLFVLVSRGPNSGVGRLCPRSARGRARPGLDARAG